MQRPTSDLSLLSVLWILAACASQADTPAKARGDTPIRYVVCAVGDRDCSVSARFATFETCEGYRQIDAMLCDRRSTPGTITCRTSPTPGIAVAYCTR
jgi:hypothetical protein